MTASAFPSNQYTHSPAPLQGLLPGSLQLLSWLLFHPTAWINHLQGIDPTLAPNFCLAQLTPAQRKNPALRRLILQGVVILPLFNIILQLLLVYLLFLFRVVNYERPAIYYHAMVILGYVLMSSLSMSISGGLAAGIVYSTAIGWTLTCISPIKPEIISAFAMAASLAGSTLFTLTEKQQAGFQVKHLTGILLSILLPATVLTSAYFFVTALIQPTGHTARFGTDMPDNLGILVGFGSAGIAALGSLLIFQQRNPGRNRTNLILAGTLGLIAGSSLMFGFVSPIDSWQVFLAAGIGGGLAFPLIFSLGYSFANRYIGPRTGSIVGALVGSLAWAPLADVVFGNPINFNVSLREAFLFLFIGLTFNFWRPILSYPILAVWSAFLYYLDQHSRLKTLQFYQHPAFWDEMQYLPWSGLDSHLLLLTEKEPDQTAKVFSFLAVGSQAWAVRRVSIELAAQTLGKCRDLQSIAQVHRTLPTGNLPGKASPILQQFNQISHDLEIALRQHSDLHQRALIGETRNQLSQLNNDLLVSSLPHAQRFTSIASHWMRILNQYIDQLSLLSTSSQGIPNPYIYGNPLDANQGIFVGRVDIMTRIEQFLFDNQHAPLLLYGQRRFGKTSLLLNLGRILPSTIIPAYVDCQECTAATDYAELLFTINQQIQRSAKQQRSYSLPLSTFALMEGRPFLATNEWLNAVDSQMEQENKYLLIKFDEIEALDQIFSRSNFPPAAFFNILRHTIQHHTRIKIILAGSHTLEELEHWSNFLINVQLIKVSYLQESEARQLIERPVPNFPLRYLPAAVQLLLALTRGHPHLVQLLCYELITLKNHQSTAGRFLATPEDVEAAAEKSFETSALFFADFKRQVQPEAFAMLQFLAARGEQASLPADAWRTAFPQDFDAHLRILLQRSIVELDANNGYRFQIELVRRWFVRAE